LALLGIIRIIQLNTLVSSPLVTLENYIDFVLGGLFGPMIIHGPKTVSYDIDLGPVFLTDYYHAQYFDIVESVMQSGGNPRPSSDNNLINGKMDFDCSTKAAGDNTKCTNNAGLSKFKFTTGKTHRLRLINGGSAGLQRFSIDNHTMTVIANDYVPVVSNYQKVFHS